MRTQEVIWRCKIECRRNLILIRQIQEALIEVSKNLIILVVYQSQLNHAHQLSQLRNIVHSLDITSLFWRDGYSDMRCLWNLEHVGTYRPFNFRSLICCTGNVESCTHYKTNDSRVSRNKAELVLMHRTIYGKLNDFSTTRTISSNY